MWPHPLTPNVFVAGITEAMWVKTMITPNCVVVVLTMYQVMAKQDATLKMNWLWLTGLVIALDQITKIASDNALIYGVKNALFPGLNFTLIYNQGAAFSFLSDAGGWQRWFFVIVSSAISVFIFLWLKKTDKSNIRLSAALALILGGAIGNLIDRSVYGYVIDFIQVYYDIYYWPTFNIADSAIFLGACLLILDIFLEEDPNGVDTKTSIESTNTKMDKESDA